MSPSKLHQARSFLKEARDISLRDEVLSRRMDGVGDELGALLGDLESLLAVSTAYMGPDQLAANQEGYSVLFDARCLQEPGLRNRGIGVFAVSLLEVLDDCVGKERIHLIVDPYSEPLPTELRQRYQSHFSTRTMDLSVVGLFVQPSPMTAAVEPVIEILQSNIRSLAVVYDFIPGQFSKTYFHRASQYIRYSSQLRCLELYSDLAPISTAVSDQLSEWLPLTSATQVSVAWPNDFVERLRDVNETPAAWRGQGCITLVSAPEPRKTPLASLEALRRLDLKTKIFGFGNQQSEVRKLLSALGAEESNFSILPRLSDDEKDHLFADSSVIIIPSHIEGLSLPVIEAIQAGTPVVASSIATHRELIGKGHWLVERDTPEAWQLAIEATLAQRDETLKQQSLNLGQHPVLSLTSVVRRILHELDASSSPATQNERSSKPGTPSPKKPTRKPNLGIFTPWPQQKTGVADYSFATLPGLHEHFEVSIYSPSTVQDSTRMGVSSSNRVLADPHRHDYFLTVMGSSRFHLPGLEILKKVGGTALCHDSRAIDFYAHLGGVQAALHLQDLPMNNRNEQEFWRSMETGQFERLGFKEIAGYSGGLLFHSASAAERVAREESVHTAQVKFVPQRRPNDNWDSVSARADSRRLSLFPQNAFNIVSIGIIDNRTKMSRMLVEACQWVRLWGHNVALTFVGTGPAAEIQLLRDSIDDEDKSWFKVTGFVDDGLLINYMLAADLSVQLRSGDLQMLSGPVFDNTAFGLRTLLTENLSDENSLPSFQSVIPNQMSSFVLAQKIMEMIESPYSAASIEEQRRAFLEQRSIRTYDERLTDAILKFGKTT